MHRVLPSRTTPLAALTLALSACVAGPGEPPHAPATGTLEVTRLATLDLEGATAQAITYKDSVAYVACGNGGLFAVDVSRPEAPAIIAHDAAPADALCLAEDVVYTLALGSAFQDERLRSLDVIDPAGAAWRKRRTGRSRCIP